ncbi:hypothetical protein niasHT_012685 [Heterodera trifolii]|uniref:Uncharacterized protein n=1 Tax=Heterodera trifolii TaxID=157864 RepID=A0ABD2L1V2_9BILA
MVHKSPLNLAFFSVPKFVRLLLLVVLAFHRSKPNQRCIYSANYSIDFSESTKGSLVSFLQKWGVEKNKRIKPCQEEGVACQTYRCKDRKDGHDLFLVNACATPDELTGLQCSHRDFDPFCLDGEPQCKTCRARECLDPDRMKLEGPKKVEFGCLYAFTADKKTFQPTRELVTLLKRLEINTKAGKAHVCGDGRVGCQTYRCKNEDGNDQFVVNACAEKGKNCSAELDSICKKQGKKWKGICENCDESECNANKTNLENKGKSGNKTELVNNKGKMCHSIFFITNLYSPNKELTEWLRNKGLPKTNNWHKIECEKKMKVHRCQNLTCKDEKDNLMFEFQHCAELNGNCSTKHLAKFCEAPGKLSCNTCRSSKCKKNDPLLSAAIPNSKLQCLAWSICEVQKNKNWVGMAKLSRRFKPKNCIETIGNWLKMANETISEEYDESADRNGQVFLADFFKV